MKGETKETIEDGWMKSSGGGKKGENIKWIGVLMYGEMMVRQARRR